MFERKLGQTYSWRKSGAMKTECLVLGVIAALGLLHLSAVAGEERFVFEKAEMGVPFRITLYAPSAPLAQAAAEVAFQHVEELNSILSDYDPDSEISRLARTSGQGRAVPVSTTLRRVLERSQALALESDGAFDVTVGPLVNLWRRMRRQRTLPDPATMAEMRQRVGSRHLKLHADTQAVELLQPDMRLDVGGIAKGYAVDEALAILTAKGFPRALVAASGDIVAGDPPPGEAGWRVGIESLAGKDVPGPVLLLAHQAVSTSGDAYQFVEIDGVRYSHIVDPRSGIGLTKRSLVTVVAPNGLTADGLDTTIDILGSKAGLALAAKHPESAVYFQEEVEGKVVVQATANWREVRKIESGR